MADSGVIYLGTYAGLYKSTNYGAFFTLVFDDYTVNAIFVHPVNTQIVLIAAPSVGIFKSTDGGANWTQVLSADVAIGNFAALTADIIYATSYTGGDDGFYRSTDCGDTWEAYGDWATSGCRALAIDPVSKVLYCANENGFFKSLDYGETWIELLSLYMPAWDVQIDWNDRATIYMSHGSTVYKSTDSGANWTEVLYAQVQALAIHPTDGSIVYGGTYQVSCYKTVDDGANWSLKRSGIFPTMNTGKAVRIEPNTPAIVYLLTETALYKSTDGADNWSSIFTGSCYSIALAELIPIPVPTFSFPWVGRFQLTHVTA
jgi:photosystem II stability/assembly factor-like uncharacterized protein